MPPKTSITTIQIKNIFAHYKLPVKEPVARVEAGFTNEVHQVGDYMLKVCVRENFEERFATEARLYKDLYPEVLVPKLLIADDSHGLIPNSFMIYERAPGEPLGHVWHTLADKQRRQLIGQICQQIKLIAASEPDAKFADGQTWQGICAKSLADNLKPVKDQKLLNSETILSVETFIKDNLPIMRASQPVFLYWDVHLDNFIVSKNAELTAIIDLEHVNVFSIDYLLVSVRRMMCYPQLNLAAEMEKYADPKDYTHLTDWFRSFWPELFEFQKLERRLDIYELDEVLRHLPRFPKAEHLYERLNRILS